MLHHSPLDMFAKGLVVCGLCAEEIPIEEHKGLTNVPCPNCGGSCFIPLKISNFWLFKPLAIGGMGAVYKAYKEQDLKNKATIEDTINGVNI